MRCVRRRLYGADDQSISNIRGIRVMALDVTFRERFQEDAKAAKQTGRRAAWVVAVGTGATAGLPLFAQGERLKRNAS